MKEAKGLQGIRIRSSASRKIDTSFPDRRDANFFRVDGDEE